MKFPWWNVWIRFDRGSASPIASLEPYAVICICMESLNRNFLSNLQEYLKAMPWVIRPHCSFLRLLPLFLLLLQDVPSHFFRPGEEKAVAEFREVVAPSENVFRLFMNINYRLPIETVLIPGRSFIHEMTSLIQRSNNVLKARLWKESHRLVCLL